MNFGLLSAWAFIAAIAAATLLTFAFVVSVDLDSLFFPVDGRPTPVSPKTSDWRPAAEADTQRWPVTVGYSPSKVYLGDDVMLYVQSGGLPLKGASVYLDGVFLYQTHTDYYPLLALDSGTHYVVVSLEGYGNATLELPVDRHPYIYSKDVKVELSEAQRQEIKSEGKVDVRFYETSSCINCKVVLSRLADLVGRNRDCVVFERLGYWEHSPQLLSMFSPTDELPYIVVEGRKGVYKIHGSVTADDVREMIRQASSCSLK